MQQFIIQIKTIVLNKAIENELLKSILVLKIVFLLKVSCTMQRFLTFFIYILNAVKNGRSATDSSM